MQIQDRNLGDLMQTYAKKVTPINKGAAQEFGRISRLIRERDLMITPLLDAKPHIFASFRDRHLKDGVSACPYDVV